MASTYTDNLGIEKPGSGEQAGTWGTTTNTNFDIIDAAVNGVLSLPVSASANLTTTDGAVSNGGHKVLLLTNDSLGGPATLTITPNDQDKFYLVQNSTGQTITFQQGDGDGGGASSSNDGEVSLINGETAFIFANGTGSNSIVTKVNVGAKLGDNLDVNGKSIVTTSNGNIVLAPNGTGDVQVDADTLRVGDADADAAITTNGTGDLTLSTNSGTNSGTVVIADGANGDITVTPNGTGQFIVSGNFTVNGGSIVFEGATADDHETTFAVTDPTADRTITFPDASGTVALSDDISSAVPAGTVFPTARAHTNLPSGFLLCAGQAVSRSTYATLFAAIGTIYGTGDGSSTFNLPDLRGRVVAGKDDMNAESVTSADRLTNQTGGLNGDTLGATGGSETHTLTTAQLAAHTHSDGSYVANTTQRTSSGENQSGRNLGSTNGDAFTTVTLDVSGTSGSTGSGSAHNNVQPTIVLNYMIKT